MLASEVLGVGDGEQVGSTGDDEFRTFAALWRGSAGSHVNLAPGATRRCGARGENSRRGGGRKPGTTHRPGCRRVRRGGYRRRLQGCTRAARALAPEGHDRRTLEGLREGALARRQRAGGLSI